MEHNINIPKLAGVINITPDSFSDGGLYNNEKSIMERIEYLINNGSSIIDMGAESTRPGATPLSQEEEFERLKPLLKKSIDKIHSLGALASLDSRHAASVKYAIDNGIDWINDVSGGNSEEIVSMVAKSNVKFVIMHNLGVPAKKEVIIEKSEDPVEVIKNWSVSKIANMEKHGIKRERLIIDPGVGFGKDAEQSLTILRNGNIFTQLGVKTMFGYSRKSFLASIMNSEASNRDIETLATSFYLTKFNIDYIRIHNTEIHHKAFLTLKMLIEGK